MNVVEAGRGSRQVDKSCQLRRWALPIFEPFFTTREAGTGPGFGLAIARQVINAAGGTIEVGRSSLGGAAFVARIPIEHSAVRVSPLLPID